ncbi:uncharacterized protein LOC132705676 [Cylas formicarius]|uniref:uncharacterized protein LOC132705676 n=1 Tax=Cylas formicarius TaxID=197179 RepID=UPI0029589E87|nr:uncharacterized protein LOC132705676 [Cylas formicarius]XP_060532427.1 uncharacterized protein LOC132705676 [Cylas formicarius]
MANRGKRWKLFWVLAGAVLSTVSVKTDDDFLHENHKGMIVPRIDYDQWKPLGRGDPLKNDPTFDYVPPVLDQVRYWVDPKKQSDSKSSRDNPKKEILLLGVSSKKPAVVNPVSRKDSYSSYSKYSDENNYVSNQRISRPSFFPSMSSSMFPSIFTFANKIFDRTAHSKEPEHGMPYTVLMPPPIEPQTKSSPSPKYSTSTPSVTIQESNLVYHSSSLSDPNEFKPSDEYVTSSPSVHRELSPTTEKQVLYVDSLSPSASYMPVKFAPDSKLSNKVLEASDSNHNINYVTPPPLPNLESQILVKGKVTDDNEISNTYVKIEKPLAQMHSTGVGMDDIVPMPMGPSREMFSPLTMQTIIDMQTMQPPPPTQSPVFIETTRPVVGILKKEQVDTTQYLASASEIRPTTTITTTEEPTTVNTLTTDPLKTDQVQPLKAPLYLIIQGHSKVKTYKPAKQIDGIMIRDTNEITNKLDGVDFDLKHLHGFKSSRGDAFPQRKARNGNLQTLKHIAQTGFGSIEFGKVNLQEAEVNGGYEVRDAKDTTSETYHKGIVETARKLEP